MKIDIFNYLFASFMKGIGPQIQQSLRFLWISSLPPVSARSFPISLSVDDFSNISGNTSCKSDTEMRPKEYLPAEIKKYCNNHKKLVNI